MRRQRSGRPDEQPRRQSADRRRQSILVSRRRVEEHTGVDEAHGEQCEPEKTRAPPVVNAVGSAIAAMSIAAIATMIKVRWITRAVSNVLVSQA